jgi:ribosome-binding protein aMBF1 (putative translation factor)
MMTPIADPLVQVLDNKRAEKMSWSSRSPSNKCIGNRLRIRRISYGISGEELSERLGIDNDDLDLYEAGTKRLNANLLLRIAKLLDVQPDYFFQDYAKGEP